MTDKDLEAALHTADNVADAQETIRDLVTVVRELRTALAECDANADALAGLARHYDEVHAANVNAGWWTDIKTGQPKKRSVGEMFVLIVTELAEAYRAYINGDLDDKLPLFPGLGVEIGDVQIRLADFAGALRAGRIVKHSNAANPGDYHFIRILRIAEEYEAIRKTPQAVGEPETGAYLPAMNVVPMIAAKLAFNATRADHKIENRLKDGGKQT